MISANKRVLQRFRVPLGFLFAVLFLIFAQPQWINLVIGGAFSLAGLLVRAWASGHIRKNTELAVSGPYAHTRNPLYLGSFLLGAGFTFASGLWWLPIVFCVLFLSIYLTVMKVEMADVHEIFGKDYEEYAASVPLFFPRFTPWKKSNEKFDFQLYLNYREYRAALGLVFALGILAAKAFFFR